MADSYIVKPFEQPVSGSIRPPGSKSLTNRALIIAALALGKSKLTGVLESRDTEVMIESLKQLGLSVSHDTAAKTIDIVGCGGHFDANQAELWLENSGTSIRFLTAFSTLGHGTIKLDGNDRMRERPIGDLVDALNVLGAQVSCDTSTSCPPVTVEADGLPGGQTTVAGSISSQYLSALLMTAPCAVSAVEIDVEGELVSQPYVDMTLGVMARFGVTADCPKVGHYRIDRQQYQAAEYAIEPDASAASYFLAAAAITCGTMTVEGLSHHSLQGDIEFVEALEQMGCRVNWGANSTTLSGADLHGIDIDMNAFSDTAQTLAVVAPFADGPTRIYNIGHVRHKETNRIHAVVTELRKLGLRVDEKDDEMTIHPGPISAASIETYDDHRMAMSFALIGLKVPGIEILDPGCTAKTYPNFFEDLESLRSS